jgi:hypothetical protein
MKTLLRRLLATLLRQRQSLPDRPNPQPHAGSHILWKGKMLPLTQDRLHWVEARLFTLARMAVEMAANRQAYQGRLRVDIQVAAPALQQAYMDIQAERALLMVERQVIEQYLHDQQAGTGWGE